MPPLPVSTVALPSASVPFYSPFFEYFFTFYISAIAMRELLVWRKQAEGGGSGGEEGQGTEALTMVESGSHGANGGAAAEEAKKGEAVVVDATPEEASHPYDFQVSGPRNLSSPNWRDLICSSWKDPNYKRMVVACFIQAVYLLELDRREKKPEENGLAPRWWKPFKYKLVQTLVDERDGSVYGAVLEWDRSAALHEFILLRPSGAPKAVLVLRGTLLKSPTIRRDIEDDLRFLAWESLKGSVRYSGALEALKSLVDKFGSNNICIGGHSLGAGFALQVGKALAKQGVFVECHLFNPPSVSVAMSLKNLSEKAKSLSEKAIFLWKKLRENLHLRGKATGEESPVNGENVLCTGIKKWVPHLYVNNSDYICCYYTDPAGTAFAREINSDKSKKNSKVDLAAKLFIMSKGPKRFLEAHGLEQWWSDDMELQLALHDSKLINRQLSSLYAMPPP